MKLDKLRRRGDTEKLVRNKEIMFSGSVPLCLRGDERER